MKNEYIPQACTSICNNLSMTIMIIDDEQIRYKIGNQKPSRTCKIYTTGKGRAYFRVKNTRYYIDNFMVCM